MCKFPINIRTLYAIIYLCASAIACTADNLDKVLELNECKVRISFSKYDCVIGGLSIDTFYKYATCEIIYSDISTKENKWKSFVESINGFSLDSGRSFDPKWAFLITDKREKIISICYADALCKEGWLNGKMVKFDGKLHLWLQRYLTEAFDLNNEPSKSNITPQKK